jgi:hypothetical protein
MRLFSELVSDYVSSPRKNSSSGVADDDDGDVGYDVEIIRRGFESIR